MSGLRSAWRILRHLIATLVALILFAPGYSQVPRTPPEIRAQVAVAARAAAANLSITLDPRVIDEMTASAQIFVGNFCYPPDSADGIETCRKTFGTASTMIRTAQAFLADARSNQAEIQSFGARLAVIGGSAFAAAGWSDTTPNRFGIVDMPADLAGSAISVRTATGEVSLGKVQRQMLASPGRVSLIIKAADGGLRTFTVDVVASHRIALGPATSSSAAVELGDVAPSMNMFCFSNRPNRFEGPTAYFNWGRGTFVEDEQTRLAHQAPFTRYRALDILIDDQTGACKAPCTRALGANFAQAIAAWKGGCARCGRNALVIIRLGGTVWLDRRAADRLRTLSRGVSTPLDLASLQPGELEATQLSPNMGEPTSVISYSDVTQDAAVKAVLCRQSAGAAPWVSNAQAFLCPGSAKAPPVLRPVVRLTPGRTQCGPASSFLACGLPESGIEITLQDIVYRVDGPSGPVSLSMAPSPYSLNLRPIILHEVGHWFGVPHAQVQGANASLDIMGETLDDGPRCISGSSLTMLNNASDTRWSYRVTAGMGLRRPRSMTSGR